MSLSIFIIECSASPFKTFEILCILILSVNSFFKCILILKFCTNSGRCIVFPSKQVKFIGIKCLASSSCLKAFPTVKLWLSTAPITVPYPSVRESIALSTDSHRFVVQWMSLSGNCLLVLVWILLPISKGLSLTSGICCVTRILSRLSDSLNG